MLQKPIDMDRIKPLVEHCDERKRSFLRGFFDSEGSVIKDSGIILCYNSDVQLLQYVQRILNSLKVSTAGPYLRMKKGTLLLDKKKGKVYVRKRTYTTSASRHWTRQSSTNSWASQFGESKVNSKITSRSIGYYYQHRSTSPPLSHSSFTLTGLTLSQI